MNDFLLQYFPTILDFNFTAKVEEEFDEIADGNLDWQKMLGEFYHPFHKFEFNFLIITITAIFLS